VGLRTHLPTALLSRPQPHRGILLEGQVHTAQDGARGEEALIKATMGRASEAVSAKDGRDSFAHCGYHTLVQQLRKTL
jgi:hypothetical protein